MKVKGVDHPLQHVFGALSALCEEESQREVSEKEKIGVCVKKG